MFETIEKVDLTRLMVTMWAIWHARRKVIHEEMYQSPMATHRFIDFFFQELGTVEKKSMGKGTGIQKSQTPRLIPPPTTRSKLNVDGAVAKSGNRGRLELSSGHQTDNTLGHHRWF
jgi:hypothetical protein